MTLHEKHREWVEARGIAPLVIEAFGLDTRQREGANWLVLPYVENGKVVNHKWRLTTRKDHRMDTGAPLILFNADDLKGAERVIITEGEWDTLAVKTASLDHRCVSVPNGADGRMAENPWEADRYRWFQRHQDDLDRVQSFILATDGDDPGRVLAADLATLLGVERCKFLTYPDGCKDLNDVLLKHGVDGLETCLSGAKPYPVKGLYRFSDYPPRGEVLAMESNLPGVRGCWPLVPATLSVITGWSGIGKTTFLCWVIADYLQQGVVVAIASFETDVHVLLRQMRAVLMKLPVGDPKLSAPFGQLPCDGMLERQLILICQHCGDEESEMDLDYLLELGRVAVIRDGARLVIVDPWNEIEHKHERHETEHDYTGRAIRGIKRFARRHGAAFWMVAHPAKPESVEGGQKPPMLYRISGSAHWANKADYGVTVHRPDKSQPQTQLLVSKVRMGLPGKLGMSNLIFNEWESGYILEELAP